MTLDTSCLCSVIDGDGAAILDVERGLISTLNSTGAYVWQRLQRGETIETIIVNLARDSAEDPTAVERDVREFIEDLKQKSLLPR
jgi:hypothetical protein